MRCLPEEQCALAERHLRMLPGNGKLRCRCPCTSPKRHKACEHPLHLETFLQTYFDLEDIRPPQWSYRGLCGILADPSPRLLVTRFALGRQAHYTLIPEIWSQGGKDGLTLAEPSMGRLLSMALPPNGHVVHPDDWILTAIYRIA